MDYKKITDEIRKKLLKMHAKSESSHIGSALSCVDILVVLYFSIMNLDAKRPKDVNRDKFILSKGHACSALYATLALKGFFDSIYLDSYCMDGGILQGHSTKECVPGVEISSGSLGHGLSVGAGMAIAGKCDGQHYRVFVLMGDGECDEGSVWEAAMFSGNKKLDNLIAIVDYNKIQSFGKVKEVNDLEPFSDKWRSFGWETVEVDGHNTEKLVEILKKVPFKKGKPSVLIAHTIKGKGISFMENELKWHYKSPNEKELMQALKEIDVA